MRGIGRKKCFYCDRKLSRKNQSIDHLLPFSRGGRDVAGNRVWACQACNTLKGCLTVEEFRAVIAYRLGMLRKVRMKFPGEMLD